MSLIVPAEWAPHRAMWLGFPSHAELWEEDLAAAQAEVAALARALAGPGRRAGAAAGRPATTARPPRARACWATWPASRSSRGQFGDIWLRDTGPIFGARLGDAPPPSASTAGAASTSWSTTTRSPARSPRPSGVAAGPPRLHPRGRRARPRRRRARSLTTRQCLLNPNRNPGWTEATAEAALAERAGRAQGAVAGRRPAERPHRRPRRQPGPLRRAGRGRLPGRLGPRTTPTPTSTTTPRGAWPAMTDADGRAAAGDAHPLARPDRATRTATPSRPAT